MRKTGYPLARLSGRAKTPEGGCFAAASDRSNVRPTGYPLVRKTGYPLARLSGRAKTPEGGCFAAASPRRREP
jgi:hypothetical protein